MRDKPEKQKTEELENRKLKEENIGGRKQKRRITDEG